MFNTWIKKEPQGFKEKIDLFLNVFLIYVLLNLVYIFTFGNFTDGSLRSEEIKSEIRDASSVGLYIVFQSLLGSAFVEEVIFRGVPLILASYIIKIFKITQDVKFFIFVLIVSSLIFGYVHDGYKTILPLGVAGFLFGIYFLKCGGINGKFSTPLLYSTSIHFFINLCAVVRF